MASTNAVLSVDCLGIKSELDLVNNLESIFKRLWSLRDLIIIAQCMVIKFIQ